MVFVFIYLAGVLGERVQYDLRKMLFNHLQELSLSYYSQNAVGRLMARVTSDTGRVSDLVTWGMLDVTWAFMNISTATVFMLIINWKLGLIVLAAIPDPDGHRHPVPQEDPGRVSRFAPCKLQDHRRL